MKSKTPHNKTKKRIGRGSGSGTGKTSGKGHKGQKARSGGGTRPGFEGGQNPIYRRLPKRGFNNSVFTVKYQILNISDLSKLEMKEVSPESLKKDGVLNRNLPFKVLGTGELKKALVVKAHKVSQSAQAKIEKAGGRVEILKAS